MKGPKISVIVPVFNVEEHLVKCIESILGQTFLDFELILVNDGSTDNSSIICDNYTEVDPRVRTIHKENGGLSSARNVGIENSLGEYLSFVDSDDWIEQGMLECMYTEIKKFKADIVISGHYIVESDGTVEEILKFSNLTVLTRLESVSLILEDDVIKSYAWDKLYRRELFENIKYPLSRVYEDTATTYKLFNIAETVVVLNTSFYNYLRRQSSICLSMGNENELRRKHHNFLAFYERYLFTENNNDFKFLRHVCGAKAFYHGQQLIRFIVKHNLFDNSPFLPAILSDLASIETCKSKYLTFQDKLESYLISHQPGIYLLLLKFYYFLRKK